MLASFNMDLLARYNAMFHPPPHPWMKTKPRSTRAEPAKVLCQECLARNVLPGIQCGGEGEIEFVEG